MSGSTTHLVHTIRSQANKYKDRDAVRYRVADGIWEGISWTDFAKEIDSVSLGMLASGIGVQDKIGIYAQNMPNWTITDFAAQQIRAVSVSIYATSTAKQAAYIINDAGIKIMFVGDQEQYDNIIEVAEDCPSLQYVVTMKNSIHRRGHKKGLLWEEFISKGSKDQYIEIEKRVEEADLNDLMTLIYTSGTTGVPKGVMMDYTNFVSQFEAHLALIEFNDTYTNLSFLPLSHVFERAWSTYVLYRGAINYYLEDTTLIKEALLETSPDVMCAVPRFYEKIYSTVHEKVAKASPTKKAIFNWAVNVGKRCFELRNSNKQLSALDKFKYGIANKLILSKFQKLLGGNIKFMPAGGAKLDPEIGKFFHAIGIPVILGYGLTETCATVTAWHINQPFNPDSIGTPLEGVEVKIGESNEILVKSKVVMKGYYNNPEETAKVFTEDGFFRTGDAGEFDAEGNLMITDRIKELMKTSNGKYIAPQVVEGKVGKDHFVEQIAIIADGRNFVSALIVPTFINLEEYAEENGISFTNREDLILNKDIVKMYEKRVELLQHDLAKFEKIKKFTLLPNEFSIESGEMTPTLKLKRKAISERYKQQIDEIYAK
ncbi:AMP-dependent synthetase/ligase [Flammeovirga kamogawensis]|uniref:Long-chain fatty acid--CoA ligase n=1 Tax=Flammeovirga kamogawensis TaxID=373891 RepID=A0ABX8H220_9BACT|nr:long-chain fatty acid--CoA ligase [Flammeovirga kamogawensis]MBB6463735.1 long-chain acyl-CoA synthetase [Flammeovirga kamogawensis]QWG09753.1 long-chain fatty acid--CoA ligase [Flammeovirga kamogawensis]TRX65266.1 long-chain fatty acid--CoA ligase [Flammeovirga kamogawensis]